MSKLYCATCKYYDFNTCEGVDWCRLNNEETGICGNCEREFEDLDEATEHYNAVVEEENKLYSLNCEMASKVADLEHRLSNCIEPKFKIGDKVWAVYWQTFIGEKYNYEIVSGKIDHLFIDRDNQISYGTMCQSFREQNLFATEEEAKKHLEELKNG